MRSPEFQDLDSVEDALRMEERGPANLVYVSEQPTSDPVWQVIALVLEANDSDAAVKNAIVTMEKFRAEVAFNRGGGPAWGPPDHSAGAAYEHQARGELPLQSAAWSSSGAPAAAARGQLVHPAAKTAPLSTNVDPDGGQDDECQRRAEEPPVFVLSG